MKKTPSIFKVWFGHWISSWVDMICGLISIITFCMYRPWWDMTFRIWWDKRIFKHKEE